MATSNGSLRMSKKGQTRGNGQIDVPGAMLPTHGGGRRFAPPPTGSVAAVLATEIIAGAGIHQLAMRQASGRPA